MPKPKYEPTQSFTMQEDDFFGEFYQPPQNRFPGKCVILFGGSAGKFLLTQLQACCFVDAGMSAMAICYHGAPGLPKDLKEQPVDVIEHAALWLKKQGYEKVGVWGISMGGELALLAGSLLPELIGCVVAVAPLEMVMQAQTAGERPTDGSSFSFHGSALPFAKFIPQDSKTWFREYIRQSWQHKEPYTRELLLRAYAANDVPEAVIPTWNISGPVLLLGGEMDGMCPNVESFAAIQKRMQAHNFAYPLEVRLYPHLGHFVLPFKPYTTKALWAERHYPQECDAERAQSWQDTLTFLREVW